MASHAQTFVRIQTEMVCISCDINSPASITPSANHRGEHSTKIQGWEILIIGFAGTIPLVRFRNPLGVFLGVETIAENNVVTASAGLDEKSLWKLKFNSENTEKFSISNGTFFMKVNGTGIELTSTEGNATLWGINVHVTIPPLFHNPVVG